MGSTLVGYNASQVTLKGCSLAPRKLEEDNFTRRNIKYTNKNLFASYGEVLLNHSYPL